MNLGALIISVFAVYAGVGTGIRITRKIRQKKTNNQMQGQKKTEMI